MPTSITLSGFKEFEDKCESLADVLLEELDGEVEDAARVWAGLAVDAAPVDQGLLKGLISSGQVSDHSADVTSSAEHSAWMEWGTKSRVSVPAELQSYASTFIGGGKGSGNAKEMIYAWMGRVGVPKEFQWPTFISIITKGVHPHPFFFIQEPIVEKQFLENCQKILNTEH